MIDWYNATIFLLLYHTFVIIESESSNNANTFISIGQLVR